MEGTEHRGEACLGSFPTATPMDDDVEWKKRLFTLHIESSFSSQTLTSLGFRPNPLQLHINLSVIFSFVCSNICLAKAPISYKYLS